MKPEIDDKCYRELLETIARSELEGKTQVQVEQDLKEVSEKFGAKVTPVKQDYNTALKKLQRESTKKVKDEKPVEFSPAAKERAKLLWECPDKLRVFHEDFNKSGYSSTELMSAYYFAALHFQCWTWLLGEEQTHRSAVFSMALRVQVEAERASRLRLSSGSLNWRLSIRLGQCRQAQSSNHARRQAGELSTRQKWKPHQAHLARWLF